MDLTTTLLAAIIISELAIGIYVWKEVRAIYVSKYRGYDFLFLSWITMLVVARAVALLQIRYVQGGTFSVVDVLRLTDLNFEYLIFPYIPLLVFMVWSTQIEVRKDWRNQALPMLFYGVLITIPIALVQVVRGMSLGWESDNFIYHVLQTTILVLLAILFYRSIHKKGRVLISALPALGLLFALLSVTFWLPPFLSAEQAIAKLAAQASFAAVLLIPLVWGGMKPRGRQQDMSKNIRMRR